MNQKELINSKIISYNDGNAKQVTFIMINIIIHDLKYSTLGFIPNQSEIWVILSCINSRHENCPNILILGCFGMCQMNYSYNTCKNLDVQCCLTLF